MVLIGGAGTISGSIMGALFITLLPTLTRELPAYVPFISARSTDDPQRLPAESILYGLLIIGFLLFEPRGLFGIWVRDPQLLEGLAVQLLTAPRVRSDTRRRVL